MTGECPNLFVAEFKLVSRLIGDRIFLGDRPCALSKFKQRSRTMFQGVSCLLDFLVLT
jgi:hypothetical protein